MHLTPITALHAWYFKSIPLSSTEIFHNLINPLTADSCFAENCWYKSLQLCLKYHFFCSIFSANSVSNTISSAQYSLPILSQIPFLLLNTILSANSVSNTISSAQYSLPILKPFIFMSGFDAP